MNKDERDTKFLGFAKLLADELLPYDGYQFGTDSIRLIAQRAYDLAYHILIHETMDVEAEDYRSIDEVMARDIPDLTAWPPTMAE